ncbi:hypothetical protein FOL46_000803 [Perkinsus olseni]|uniref:Uncharacterized protein n=1 Tax=Perkinsus olseni TaxID=32597 RepID=A0A7J6KUW1_PEROL|nr:hypothetical protein FOL46_000803 [Perkinsus olseni]
MAPRAASNSDNDDLPLSEIDDLVLDNVESLCLGKPLRLGIIMPKFQAIVGGALKEKEVTLDSAGDFIWRCGEYYLETMLSSKPSEVLLTNFFDYVWPHFIDDLGLSDSIEASRERDIRARKITALKFLNFDKASIFEPSFPDRFPFYYRQSSPTPQNPSSSSGSQPAVQPVKVEPSSTSLSKGQASEATPSGIDSLLPVFSGVGGPITSQDRRDARKTVSNVELLQGGSFSGKDDSRSIRRVLVYLRDLANEECWSALEYREMLKRQVSREARAVVHPVAIRTYAELVSELRREVSSLLTAYGRGDFGKLESWNSLLQLRQGKTEQLSAFAQRFENAQEEARCLGNEIDDSQSALQFASAVNVRWTLSAATLIGTGVSSLNDLVSRLISEERVFRRSQNGLLPSDSVNTTTTSATATPVSVTTTLRPSNVTSGGTVAPNLTSDKICHYCREAGHVKANCPKLALKEARLRSNESMPTKLSDGKSSDNGKPAPSKSPATTPSSDPKASAMVLCDESSQSNQSTDIGSAIRKVEICLPPLSVTTSHESIEKAALFDTGATFNFIGRSLLTSLEDAGYPCSVNKEIRHSVTLADGTKVSSNGCVQLLICYDGSLRQLPFHIVPSLSPGLFIGWEGIAALGVFIDAGNNKIICSSDALAEEGQQTPLLARIGTIDENFTPVKKFDDTCDPEDDRWFHLSSAPAYRMRVRKLRPDEPRDTEEQVYCFELDLQGAMRPIDGLTRSGDYSEFAMDYLLRYTASLSSRFHSVRYDVVSGSRKVHRAWVYLDDITLSGSYCDVMAFKKMLVKTASKFGFSFPESKQEILTPDSGQKRVTHLGSLWGIEDGVLKCFCKRNTARFDELCRVPVRSKRHYFALAGLLTDYPVGHARSRLAVDVMRSIVGSYKGDWDAKLDLSDDHVRQLDKLISIVKDDFERPCQHCSASGDNATLECDASSVGFGYIFKLGSFESSRAKPFSKSQSAWHVNRREAWCILQGLLANLPLLEEFTADREAPLRLTIVSDSKSAISWLRDNHIYAKSVERLALRRMLNTLEDIRHLFDQMNVRLVFEKIAGVDNSAADDLSRLLNSWGISSVEDTTTDSTPSTDLKALQTAAPSEELGEEPDINGPVEVCSQVMDIDSAKPDEVVKWLWSVQDGDSFISELRDFLSNESKNDYLRRLLKNEGRWYALDRHGLVVECRFRDGEAVPPRFCVLLPNDPTLLSDFARHYHETNGHCSLRYVQYLFTRDFVAPKFKQAAATIIKECPQCVEKRVKLASSGGRSSYGDSTADLDGVWCTVYSDIGDMLVKDRFGFRYFVALVDALSSFCWLVPLRSLEARELCRAVSGVCERIGWCHHFKSDNGGGYISRTFRALLSSQGVSWSGVPRHSPFSNGKAERCIGSVKAKFSTMSRAEKREWSVHLAYVNRCVNLVPLDNGLTAFETFFQRPYNSILDRKFAAVDDLVMQKTMDLEDKKPQGHLKSFSVGSWVRRCNPAVKDKARYKVVEVHKRSVGLQLDGDPDSPVVLEHVRNIVAANAPSS